jgi:stage IV sporulation protein FB
MGWEDRPYYDNDSQPLEGVFAPPPGPSIGLFTALGARVRVHFTLPLFLVLTFALNWQQGYTLASKIISLAALVVLVMLHELGQLLAARAAGIYIVESLLWPLGGLYTPDIRRRKMPAAIAALGGPLVNLMLCITCAAIVQFVAGQAVRLNPFHPLPPAQIASAKNPALYAWWMFVVSYDLLILNLLPIVPLDGSRVLHALLRTSIGSQRAALATARLGMVGSVMLMVFGCAPIFHPFVVVIGAALLGCSYHQWSTVREIPTEHSHGEPEFDYGAVLHPDPLPRARRRVSRWKARRLRRQAEREAAELQLIDIILAKVSANGLRSLSWRERRALRRATRRQREMEPADSQPN